MHASVQGPGREAHVPAIGADHHARCRRSCTASVHVPGSARAWTGREKVTILGFSSCKAQSWTGAGPQMECSIHTDVLEHAEAQGSGLLPKLLTGVPAWFVKTQ